MGYFDTLMADRYEGLHFVSDGASGLRGLIGLHSTRLGPAIGGTRALATYASEEAAVQDVLRLSRGMSYKAALAGLPHGGGKSVIMLPRGPFDRERLFEAFGRAVHRLGGAYLPAEDSGTGPEDMAFIRRATPHVLGLAGKSGDPSPVTAFGVLRGIQAAARRVLGRSDLQGLRVTVMGVGHVGLPLCELLHQQGAKLWVSDVDAGRMKVAVDRFGATALSPEALVAQAADVYAPCALGGAINDTTLPLLKVKLVAGAANNQLAEARHGEALANRGITYCPDYAINAGGLINVAAEVGTYDREKAYARAALIHDTIDQVLARAKETGLRPEQVADKMVEEKLYG